MSRRSRSAGPTTTARSTIVPSDLRSGTSSIRVMDPRLAAQAEAQIKIAYERYAEAARPASDLRQVGEALAPRRLLVPADVADPGLGQPHEIARVEP
jgi:hypothetical protein